MDNFDGPMQKTHRIIFSVWRYCSISDSVTDGTNETDFMYDKTNVALFSVLFSNNFVTILLNNSALTKSSKVSLQGLFPNTFAESVNPWSSFSNPPKS